MCRRWWIFTAVWLAADAMSERAVIVLKPGDHVGVTTRALRAGETVAGVDDADLTVTADIPRGHKIALTAIDAGGAVKKYGQFIGDAAARIQAGEHVHLHNLNYRSAGNDYQFCTAQRPTEFVAKDKRATFMGYRRADGRAGTRNFIGVLSSVNCSATAAHMIAAHFTPDKLAAFPNVDGVTAFVHAGGCGIDEAGEGAANLRRVMEGYARHANLAGALVVGLGCEVNQADTYAPGQGNGGAKVSLPTRKIMNIQGCGGLRKTVAAGIRAVEDMLPAANRAKRTPCPASELTLALQCGGSDGWSGVTANPALGHAADLLVRHGGTAVLAETPEVYGAEHLLVSRAADPATAQKLVERIAWWEDYTARNNGSMNNNPTPGNKRGGLTTILEKSLGAVAKGGSTNMNGVYRYAEPVTRKGFVLMDTPGYDPASVTGEIAGGCNLVAFTTGRGSAFGSKPAPCIKITSNSDIFRRMPEDMDINAGAILESGATVASVGEEIFRKLLAVASGEQSLSEAQGLGDHEFVPWHIGATM